jgi:hypothetical protein
MVGLFRLFALASVLVAGKALAFPITISSFSYDYDINIVGTYGSASESDSDTLSSPTSDTQSTDYSGEGSTGEAVIDYFNSVSGGGINSRAETGFSASSYNPDEAVTVETYLSTTILFDLAIESVVAATLSVDVYSTINAGSPTFLGSGEAVLEAYDSPSGEYNAIAFAERLPAPNGSDSVNFGAVLDAGQYRLVLVARSDGSVSPGGDDVIGGTTSEILLTAEPVPEPATLAVLGLGALALRRRRPRA